MEWNELFNKTQEPLYIQIKEYINTPLWDDLSGYLQHTYKVQPKLFYSCCSMDQGFWKGWNIKYKKSGKSLCTIYPKQGHFIALIPIGTKEIVEADYLMPICDEYTQTAYNEAVFGATGKSLPLAVTSESILCDVKNLVALRVRSGKAPQQAK